MNAFGTPESIGETNKKLILNRLRTQGNMSRADLSRSIGMSFTAIASNVKYLLDREYIQEVGAGDNSHGRKATLLSFNATRGYVVGVDIGRTKIRCMLADLLGREVATAARSSRRGGGGRGIIESVCDVIGDALDGGGISGALTLCVCIGIPGIEREGKLHLAPYFAELSIARLRAALARRYTARVLVENGVNLGAIGEHRYGRGAKYADMAYISYGVGLGAALVLGGSLHTGFNKAAGEIGFMQTRPDAARTRFNEAGDVESAVAPGAAGRKTPGRASARDIERLLRGSRAGDDRALAALGDIAAAIGLVLVNVSAVVNPQAIILSGGMGKSMGEVFLPQWREHLARFLPFPPELHLSDLGERETMLGAVGTAVDYVETMDMVRA